MAEPAYGLKSWVLFDFESSFATEKGTPAGYFLSVIKNTLHQEQALIPNNSLRSDFNRNDSADGDGIVQGDLVIIPTVDTLPLFFRLLCGNLTTTGSADPWAHAAKISTNGPLSGVFETKVNMDGTIRYAKSNGVRINRMSFGTGATGFLELTLGLIGKTTTVGSTSYNASATDWRAQGTPLDALKIAAADTKVGGSAVTYVGNVGFDIDAGLATDDRRVGQGAYLQSLIPGPHGVTGTIDVVLESTGALTFGTGGAFSSLDLTWTATAASRLFRFNLGRIKAQANGPMLEGPGRMRIPVRYEASYYSTDSTAMTATITNGQAAAVYA